MDKPVLSYSGWWMLFIMSVTGLAYIPAVTLYLLWDDFNLIKIAGKTSIGALFKMEIFGYYRPVLMLSYAFEYGIWQTWVPGYHITNVALHLTNTALVCLLAQRILVDHRAWILCGLFFGLTATHAHSVLWVCGRTDLMCATFYLLSVLTYLAFLEQGSQKLRVVSLGAFALSLLSKEMAGSLPLVCLIWGLVFFWRQSQNKILRAAGKAFKASWPFFSLLAAYFGVRYLIFGHYPTNPTHSSWILRAALGNLARYSLHLVSPVSTGMITSLVKANPALAFVGAGGALAVLFLVFRWTTNRQALYISVLWIGITLLPVLRAFGSWYLYIPGVGMAFAFGLVFNTVLCRIRSPWLQKSVMAITAMVVLLGLYQIQRDTMVASEMARTVVSDLVQKLPKNTKAMVLNLPSEYRSTPVFGWPGNLTHALNLFGHPLSIDVLSSLRYTSRKDSVQVKVNPNEKLIQIHLMDQENFFLVHDATTIAGRTHPHAGYTYETPHATVKITGLNLQGQPSSLKARMKSPLLTEKGVPLLLFNRGHVKAVESRP